MYGALISQMFRTWGTCRHQTHPKARSGCVAQTSSKGQSLFLPVSCGRHLSSRFSYFKQEALTKETITEDGWFKTGDIGQWEADGTLSIIDRIKNLVSISRYERTLVLTSQVKLQNGEYIALDKLESIYKACGESTLIEYSPARPLTSADVVQFICICAPSYADKPIALIYPVRPAPSMSMRSRTDSVARRQLAKPAQSVWYSQRRHTRSLVS